MARAVEGVDEVEGTSGFGDVETSASAAAGGGGFEELRAETGEFSGSGKREG